MIMLRLFVVFAALLSALGCSTLQSFLFPETADKSVKISWEKDLKFQIDGRNFVGTAVVPSKSSYEIFIFPPSDQISRLQWRTCHRGGAAKDAVKAGKWPWSKSEKYFRLSFQPRQIELERACALKIEALAKNKKALAFGMIAFPDSRPWFDLPATLECNGDVETYTGGTSLCQAPQGAITRVVFGGAQEILIDDTPDVDCPPLKNLSPGVFEFQMPKDHCVYNFVKTEEHKSGKLRAHKLLTFGFEASPPQEE